MTVSSFGQTGGIEFECVGAGSITFGAPDGTFNGKTSWSNGVDFVGTPGYTLRFEVDNTWSVRDPNGPRFFFSNVDNNGLPSCDSVDWERDLAANGAFCGGVVVTCITPPDPDNDGDGFPASVDCNDNDATVNSEQEYFIDADFDGFGSSTTAFICSSSPPAGYSSNSDDCDDLEHDVYPGAPEICDGLDNNCDGEIDEGIAGCIDGVIIEYCDDKQKKILVCHNGKTKCVSINAMDAHLAHGDYLGTCGSIREGEVLAQERPTSYDLVSWPNPTNDLFSVRMITPNYEAEVNLQAFDINGRLIYTDKINANEDYRFGYNLQAGIYFVKVTQGETTQVIKVIKQ